MSDESISHREDRENLLYIFKKIKKLERYQLVGDDVEAKESTSSSEELSAATCFESELNLNNVIGKQAGPDIFKDPEMIAKTKPFDFEWSYGLNPKKGLINLTTDVSKEVLFVGSHLPILYDYCTKQMYCLEGHQHLISCISADATGRWLVTADEHKDGYVIVWDREDLKPVYTLFNLYSGSGTIMVKLSWSAKYLITIGLKDEGTYSVDFWAWTLGHEDPDDSFEVSKTNGAPMEVCFNPNMEEHIMLVFRKEVFFLVWDEEENKFIKSKNPPIPRKGLTGYLTAGTYLYDCHECYVCTTKGCILIFANTLYAKPFEEGELDNLKVYRNAIKVSNYVINCCVATLSALVIADESGAILFFDRTIRILYWLKKFDLSSVLSISFHIVSNIVDESMSAVYVSKPYECNTIECEYEDITASLEKIYKEDLPKDASLMNDPFLTSDFFVGTVDGNIYAIDFLKNKCIPMTIMTDEVSSLEIHDEFPYLLIGFDSGRIQMVNYDLNKLICSTVLPLCEGSPTSVTCLSYSPGSLHLVCGRQNGEIWILEPIMITPKVTEPFWPTKNRVQKIVFSKNIVQFAYYDNNMTVVLFNYNTEQCEWIFAGKIRSHYDSINDILFMPIHHRTILYTIACDRHLIGYTNLTTDDEGFNIETRHRIEQRAIPVSMIQWQEIRGEIECNFFLIADNEHKFKLVDAATKIPIAVMLAPAYGCFKNQIISKMMIVPRGDALDIRYMTFMSSKFIGLHIVPPDGNPYKYVGYMAHPSKVEDFCLSPDGKHVFTFGTEDSCVFKWRIKTKAAELMTLLGGKELEPYYCLIEGGKNGWLFQEIKDLFYYMQILQNDENFSHPRRISDSIEVEDLPDLVRTCGFFPSEFELENMMIDIQYRNYHETALLNTEINFIDFVKLFCNHKPVYGYSKDKVRKAFETILQHSDSSDEESINREEFCSIVSYAGEIISPGCLVKLMKTLLRSDHSGGTLEFLPEDITFKVLFEDVFGIDMARAKINTKPEFERQDSEFKEELQ